MSKRIKTLGGRDFETYSQNATDTGNRFFFDVFDSYEQLQEVRENAQNELIANNFQGKEGQSMPTITDEFVMQISERYILLFEEITGKQFVKETLPDNYKEFIYNQISSFI